MRNEPVILEFISADVNMGFRQLISVCASTFFPRVSCVQLVPDKVGSFEFRCDVFCDEGTKDTDSPIHVVA
jgi:heme/copper-type cytochrome/quinol oxidase subunit 2